MTIVFYGGATDNVTAMTGGGNTAINGTSGIIPPTWTTATRPSTPVNGQQGWNTDVGYELYVGSWKTVVAKG